jgi:hypothetical protein
VFALSFALWSLMATELSTHDHLGHMGISVQSEGFRRSWLQKWPYIEHDGRASMTSMDCGTMQTKHERKSKQTGTCVWKEQQQQQQSESPTEIPGTEVRKTQNLAGVRKR